MKMWNRNEGGGRKYIFHDDKGHEFTVTGYDTDWPSFIRRIEMKMRNNGITVPDGLSDLVEDQICQRLPKGKCYSAGLGDTVSGVIHTFAAVADKVTSRTSFPTQLEKKAKGCSGCRKRSHGINVIGKKIKGIIAGQ